MNRSESRYFATAARMDEAFLTLLAKKDFEYITVKEICEVAGVNRSTFYLHYALRGMIAYALICVFTVWCMGVLTGTWRTMLIAFLGLVHPCPKP